MKTIILLLYTFLCMYIGLCYPRCRDLVPHAHWPVSSIICFTAGILLLAKAWGMPMQYLLCVPSVSLCACKDAECGEIPDLCHLPPLFCAIFLQEADPCWAVLYGCLLSCFALAQKLGWGDVKYLSAYALLLKEGIAAVIALACILALVARYRKRPDAGEFAFGPYLSLSLLCVFFFQR
jgi:hypothetical protein